MIPVHYAHEPFRDYALLDSGEGEKLERFGELVLARPDPQALWRRRTPDRWRDADLRFVRESDRGGRWERGARASTAPRSARRAAGGKELEWTVAVGDARFVLRATPFKHVGLFPEQSTNWAFVARHAEGLGDERPRLLNLFGYSGAASVLAAQAGYTVTHVDASKMALAWTRTNLAASGMPEDALRLILDDALAFVRREERRGRRYHAILVDPPHYGRGPKGETWRFEASIAALIESCAALLAERSFLVLSAYAIGISPLTLENLLAPLPGGALEVGELALPEESAPEDASGAAVERWLPAGFCARWTRGLAD